MDDADALLETEEPVGTATVLAVIAATMVGFAAVVAVLAVGVLDVGMPQLPEIRDDGTDGEGIPNLEPGDLSTDGNDGDDAEATNDSDVDAENASGTGAP